MTNSLLLGPSCQFGKSYTLSSSFIYVTHIVFVLVINLEPSTCDWIAQDGSEPQL